MTDREIIVGLGLIPFCSACGGSLELQTGTEAENIWGVQHAGLDTHNKPVTFVRECPKCGKAWANSVISWRVRRGDATD